MVARAVARYPGWLLGVAMRLLGCCYVVARVLWVVARVFLCGC